MESLLIGSWIPNIVAFLVTVFVLKRKDGIRKLFKGWLKVKVPVFWYLVTLSSLILSVLSILIYRFLYDVVPVEGILYDPTGMVVLLVMVTLTGALAKNLAGVDLPFPGFNRG